MSNTAIPELPPLPKGEVMAHGVINGMRVELVRYTEDDLRFRDRQWQYKVDTERDTARGERCQRMNLELDLRRLLDGGPTLCDFQIVEELRAALASDRASPPEPPQRQEPVVHQAASPNVACTAAVDEGSLARDAARYRWLRAQLPRRLDEEMPSLFVGVEDYGNHWGLGGEQADDAIDAAMKEQA